MRSSWLVLAILFNAAGAAVAQTTSGLRFSGDFRVRYENTSQGNGALSTSKEVVRLRAGITYAVHQDVMVRARLATGSGNDPNSTDVALSNFVNDLEMSLDIAAVEVSRRHWGAVGGKFTNPFFAPTELVWDGDVNPQGAGARVMVGKPSGITGTLTGLYFIVDQQTGGLGSDMGGAQLTLRAAPDSIWRLAAAAAYYDYRLRSLVSADAGDIRTNRLAPGGARYFSDFDLVDMVATVEHLGLGERWPLRLVGDYVKNRGAADLDAGWQADLYVGRAQRPRDWRWRYGYAVVETDAVLAAFSHDNTTIATNTETHTLAVDALPINGLLLNATWYLYRPHVAQAGAPREFQHRLRLNATITF
ncbi:MAG TPA: putative porin [Gemmatimonadales bacterium]|jgi:Putative porin|nr:putative porin [Gemmatimonadales bacterium]